MNIPNISGFLVNTKRMQTELSKKEVMLKYLSAQETDTLLSSVIEGWTIQNEEGRQKYLALIEKEGLNEFILKPNEEGGRNNYFGEEAYTKLKELPEDELPNFILVRKIYPQKQENYLVGSSSVQIGTPVVLDSETSIFGSVCSLQGEARQGKVQNKTGGYLVRSKLQGVNEGGLMAGTGILGCL